MISANHGRHSGLQNTVSDRRQATKKLVLALPKGRILSEVVPILDRAGMGPEADFLVETDRRLRFRTSDPSVEIIRVRSFDVATMVAFGAADFGVCGSDVVMEFDYPELYMPLDLGVGRCRLVVAALAKDMTVEDPATWSHIRVATKYPRLTTQHFAARGVQAECIKLSGAMELAPSLGMCRRIVDLVSTGATLRANGLIELEEIAQVSARLVVNRAALKTYAGQLVGRLRRVEASLVQDAAI